MTKILLVRTDGLGDVLLSVPLAGAIRRVNPEDSVWLLTRQYTAEVGTNHPDIAGVLTIDDEAGNAIPFQRMRSLLKRHAFDSAILIYPRFRAALLLAAAGIPMRIGTGYRWFSPLLTHKIYEHRKNILKHELEYNLSLLRPLGIEAASAGPEFRVPAEAVERASVMLRRHGVGDEEPFVVLHPGSGGSALEWPRERFAELSEALIARHGLKVLITGGPEELHVLDAFRGGPASRSVIDEPLTLSELGALLQRAALVISNSTGPLHLAVAAGTEVIGLYPPILLCSPVRWGPYRKADSVLSPPCREFRTRKEALRILPDCMDMITIEMVLEMVERKIHPGTGDGERKGQSNDCTVQK